ncbi:hypothetical protein B0H10DRAFT_1363696 [Mycena sp. CBHHK59/15]|nr:hypothetical protein B0H10DRAFT_1363696 [Mycena sp. CBHHK59/15]
MPARKWMLLIAALTGSLASVIGCLDTRGRGRRVIAGIRLGCGSGEGPRAMTGPPTSPGFGGMPSRRGWGTGRVRGVRLCCTGVKHNSCLTIEAQPGRGPLIIPLEARSRPDPIGPFLSEQILSGWAKFCPNRY